MPLNRGFGDGDFEGNGFLRRGKRRSEEELARRLLNEWKVAVGETYRGNLRRSARVRSGGKMRFGAESTHVGKDEEFDVKGPAGELHGREEKSGGGSGEELQ